MRLWSFIYITEKELTVYMLPINANPSHHKLVWSVQKTRQHRNTTQQNTRRLIKILRKRTPCRCWKLFLSLQWQDFEQNPFSPISQRTVICCYYSVRKRKNIIWFANSLGFEKNAIIVLTKSTFLCSFALYPRFHLPLVDFLLSTSNFQVYHPC